MDSLKVAFVKGFIKAAARGDMIIKHLSSLGKVVPEMGDVAKAIKGNIPPRAAKGAKPSIETQMLHAFGATRKEAKRGIGL